MVQYSLEERRKLLNSLPAELKETLLSEETALLVNDICQRHQIQEKEIPIVSKQVGDILMGLLAPDNLPKTLEAELGIENDRAEKISREVNRFILFPVRRELANFYKEISFAPGGRISKKEPFAKKRKSKSVEDIYREPLE